MALMGVTLMLAACASMLPKLLPPNLTVTAVQIGKSGNVMQQPVQLRLHATNPNNRDIPIRSIDCKLEIEGLPFADGQTEESFVLPANGEVDFNVDVIANLNSALAVLASGLGSRKVNYRVYGDVHLKGTILRSIPFDQRGRVKF
jgi:LEA14-like dessication related protein